jgi:hypothetical protein
MFRSPSFLMPPPALLAFGFESLPMLGWLAAAAAPWLIHLLTRRRYRETPWAAMDFLLAAVKRRARRIQLEQLLLLLLRTLLIVAIVAAVAEPYFERVGAVFSPGGSTHRVLVIDSSYSMAYKPNDRSRFQQAKEWAAQIVQHSTPGDGFTLVQMADPPRVAVSTPALEAEPVRQEIENLELLHTGADVPATLAEVRKVIETARRDSPRLVRTEVYFFSDMQRASWSPARGSTAKAELRSRAAELASIARLHVIDLGQPDDDNLAVTALELHAPFVLAGRSVELTATLRDFGRTARTRQTVDLLVDGQPAGRQYVDVPAGGEAAVQFNQRFESPGEHAVEVRASGDALEIDNRRYLVVDVRPAVRVLLIDGRPAGDPTKASVYALANALLARSDPNERPPIEVDTVPWGDVSQRNLGRYDCVMLSNVAQFTASEARVLDNYLGHGGSLVFFLGDRVRVENYNSVLADARQPILPARLGEVATNAVRTLDPLDYRHPILQKFRGHENVQLSRSPVAQYFRVKLLGSPAAGEHAAADVTEHPPQVALALGNGDPLIVTRALRRGRVVLVTTSADTSWTLLPAWPTYLPLVRQILDWCLAGQTQPRNVSVGDALASSLDTAASVASVTIERPDGRRRAVPLETRGDYSSWSYDDTRISGIYTAQFGPPLSRTQLFAVNLNTAESDLTPVSRDELQNEVLPGVPLDYQAGLQTAGGRLKLSAEPAVQLHVGLLYAVVGLLLLETFFAWRLGYNRR